MRYQGGKNSSGSWQNIISQVPIHDRYIELFAGSAAIWRHIKPARACYLVDLDYFALQALPAGAYRLCMDALHFLAMADLTEKDFIYADPPYLFDTRRSARRLYRCEFGTIEEHEALLCRLLRTPARVAISGYKNDLYTAMLPAWRIDHWPAMTRHGVREEYLWMNYDTPAILQDGRYIGHNFTDRQRLRRLAGVERR